MDGVLPEQTAAYEALLSSYVSYVKGEYTAAGEQIITVDKNQLSDKAKETYKLVWDATAPSYYSRMYSDAYTAFAAANYPEAIELFTEVITYDEKYKDGYAAYYLAQAYNKNGDMNSARPYYQFVMDNYPGTERARTSKNYLEAE